MPLFSLLNDFATGRRRKFIGLDNYRVGRRAGWMLANVIRVPGTIAVLVGGNLWQAHQQRESGLRAYFREHAPDFRLRDAVLNLETRQITYAVVQDLLASQSDLFGIYVTGGGVEGAIDALRDSGKAGRIRLVVHPLTVETRAALEDGIVTMIIGTPVSSLARAVVGAMSDAVLRPRRRNWQSDPADARDPHSGTRLNATRCRSSAADTWPQVRRDSRRCPTPGSPHRPDRPSLRARLKVVERYQGFVIQPSL